MTERVERRPDRVAGRLLGGLARLVLAWPMVSIGLQLGRQVQWKFWPQVGTPYEGALIGSVVGLVIGLSLWRSALRPDGWRPRLADTTLVTVTLLWLGALVVAATRHIPASELMIPWSACILGSAGIAAVLRA